MCEMMLFNWCRIKCRLFAYILGGNKSARTRIVVVFHWVLALLQMVGSVCSEIGKETNDPVLI